MIGVLARALERFGPLPEAGRRALEGIEAAVRRFEADQDLVRPGGHPSHVAVLLEGYACCRKELGDGRQQITAFHLPGELCGMPGLFAGEPGHGTRALTPAVAALVPRAALLDLVELHPELGMVLWRAALADAAALREWVANLGRRTAYQRTAFLVCELVARLHRAGLVRDPTDAPAHGFPFTPLVLADALGLTPAHVVRTLWQLREHGLAEVGGALAVRDWPSLARVAAFDPAYLRPPDTPA